MTTIAAPFAYADIDWAIPERIRAAHIRSWARLAAAGEWWTGAERVSIAAECRRASALVDGLPAPGSGPAALPEAAVFAVHKLIGDLPNVTREWYEETIHAEGMSDARYIELLGVLVHVWSVDRVSPRPRPRAGTAARAKPRSADAPPS